MRRMRALVLAALAIVGVGACIGPKTSEPNDFGWPTDPGTRVTFLRGQVVDLVTRAPIAGAKLDAGPGWTAAISGPDGHYSLGEFRGLHAMALVVTAEGYDSTKVSIAMPIGETSFTVMMRTPQD